ncbi:MAG TPA: sigma-70 family RNA polymerase sigma factor [Micromonosporaceae bacterium]|jgi:RNA polymerase sigma-70 factor (ECF subfamily)
MSSTRSDDDVTALALAAKFGDRDAANAFIAATRLDVRRFVTHLVDANAAEDLVQETYLRAMRSLPRFAAQSSARTWLLAIARRVAADHIRTLMRQPRTQSSDDWPDLADRAAPRSRFDEAVAISQLVEQLDVDRRFAFVATQMLGLSYAEAAEVCDVPIGTIRSRVARARDDLVQALRGAEAEPEAPAERPTRHLRATR